MKKFLLALSLSASIFAADTPTDKAAPRLSELQLSNAQNSNLLDQLAEANQKVADLQKQVANLNRSLIRAEACSNAGISLSLCTISQDGTVSKVALPADKK